MEHPMVDRKKFAPAVKHGGYAASSLLPGEDSDAFDELNRALIAEFAPNGALEEDIVATIARYMWRKGHLLPFRIAQLAHDRYCAIETEKHLPPPCIFNMNAAKAAAEQVRKELGNKYNSLRSGEIQTFDQLERELDVEERLNAAIDRLLKQLIHVRGLKSVMSVAAASPPISQQVPRRIRAV
jgi:hypothetical protein